MIRFLIATVTNAIALWLTTLIVPAIKLHPYGGSGLWTTIASFLLVGAIFGLVNAVIAPVIKVLAIPLYILTFGLIALVINGSLLLFVAWLSNQIGDRAFEISGFTSNGLTIETLGWAILGSIVMSIATWITRGIFKIAKIR
jgi:putative membrane protein